MQFTDRNKQFTKNYRINKVDTGESILAEITRNQSDENLSAPLNKGTLINAELLNGMFAAKQNKIVPKEGILLNENRLEAESDRYRAELSEVEEGLKNGKAEIEEKEKISLFIIPLLNKMATKL